MAYESCVRCIGRTGVEQGFEASGRAGEKKRTNGGVVRGHGVVVSRQSLVFSYSRGIEI